MLRSFLADCASGRIVATTEPANAVLTAVRGSFAKIIDGCSAAEALAISRSRGRPAEGARDRDIAIRIRSELKHRAQTRLTADMVERINLWAQTEYGRRFRLRELSAIRRKQRRLLETRVWKDVLLPALKEQNK